MRERSRNDLEDGERSFQLFVTLFRLFSNSVRDHQLFCCFLRRLKTQIEFKLSCYWLITCWQQQHAPAHPRHHCRHYPPRLRRLDRGKILGLSLKSKEKNNMWAETLYVRTGVRFEKNKPL